MTHEERTRLGEALRFALEAHGDQTRKQSPVPYVSHLLQVAGLVLQHGGDADQAVAALLHDTLEDCTGVNEHALRAEFGDEVARIVVRCTDLLEGDTPGRKSAWLARKRHHVETLAGSDLRVRLVAACDKLDNLRSLVADLKTEGPRTLARFQGSIDERRWFHDALRGALGPDLPGQLSAEIDALTTELLALLPQS